jgi:hypothetical protein
MVKLECGVIFVFDEAEYERIPNTVSVVLKKSKLQRLAFLGCRWPLGTLDVERIRLELPSFHVNEAIGCAFVSEHDLVWLMLRDAG